MSMKKQQGFSIIEVLVAVVVLVFGVLGMAGLQMQAVNASEQGRYNSRAALQATSIATAMKANPAYWNSPPASITVQGTTVTGGPTAYTGICGNDGTTNTICTSTQMAYYDLQRWGTDIAGSLPVGKFSITCDQSAAPPVCTIQISWVEKNIAVRNQDAGSGALATGGTSAHTYQTLVSSL